MDNKYMEMTQFDSLIIKSMNAGLWVWNIVTGETIFNERWAEIIGYELSELQPTNIKTWQQFTHPQDLKLSNENLNKLFNKEIMFYSLEVRMRHKDDYWVWVLTTGQIVEWDAKGNPLIAIGTHIDITDHKKTDMQLIESERNLRQIIEYAFDLIYRTDTENRFTFVSSAWVKRLGYTRKQTYGRSLKDFVHQDDLEKLNEFITKVSDSDETHSISEIRLQRSDGTFRYFQLNASGIFEDDELIGFSGIARDITILIEKQKQIEYLSYHDYLTGFFNRHYLDFIMPTIDQKSNYPLAILSIDINDVKIVNDTYGHHSGDFYLKEVANKLRQSLPTNYLFRIGGDEYIAFVPNTTEEQLVEFCDNFNEAVRNISIESFKPSVAYGFVIRSSNEEDIFEDIKSADHNMYRNKRKIKKGQYR